MTDYQELREWMRQPEVQEAVARHGEPEPDTANIELTQPPLFVVEQAETEMG